MAKLDYQHLDINQKINLKGLLSAWTDITIERFQKNLDDKVYARKQALVRGSQQRDGKGRFLPGSGRVKSIRTRRLHNDWRSHSYSSAGTGGVTMSFLQYGRFVDMGVGKGTSYALSKYQRVRRNGETATRKPARWYSREKGHQVHRLRELLTKYYVNVTLEGLENYLTDSVQVSI